MSATQIRDCAMHLGDCLELMDKGSCGLGNGFRHQHEFVMHFTAGSPKYYDLGTPNVIQAKRVAPDDREHESQKPTSLLQRLIRVVTPPDGVILDPFAGSASTAVAAIAESRKFIGVERDEAHFATACERIDAAYRQQRLFA